MHLRMIGPWRKYWPLGRYTTPPPFFDAAAMAAATAAVASRPGPGWVALTVKSSDLNWKGALMLMVLRHGVCSSMNVQSGVRVPEAVLATAT
jgi:hypothetical protein